jgi:hypothetical protein
VLIVLPGANRLEREVDLVTQPGGQKPPIVGVVETPHLAGRMGGRPAIGHPQCPDNRDGAEFMPPGDSKEQATPREVPPS